MSVGKNGDHQLKFKKNIARISTLNSKSERGKTKILKSNSPFLKSEDVIDWKVGFLNNVCSYKKNCKTKNAYTHPAPKMPYP